MVANSVRLARLREAMASSELDALLVSQPESRRYLSGYTATDLPPRESAGYLLITESRQCLLTDPRTEALAAVEAPDFELKVCGGGTRMRDLLREVATDLLASENGKSKKEGFEAAHV